MNTPASPADPPSAAARLKASVPRLLVISVATAFVVGAIYYGASLTRSATFNEGRAYRVLGDVSEQIVNFHESIAGVFKLMAALPDDACDAGASGRMSPAARRDSILRNYRERLAIPGIELTPLDPDYKAACGNRPTEKEFKAVCDPVDGLDLDLNLAIPGGLLAVKSVNDKLGSACPFYWKGQTNDSFNAVISQDTFEDVLLTLRDGRVLAEVPGRGSRGAGGGRVVLQKPKALTLGFVDAARLLERASNIGPAEAAANGEEKSDSTDCQGPMEPTTIDDQVEGRSYRVFILPFRPPFQVRTHDDSKACAAGDILYVIGLQPKSVEQELDGLLWPYGTWLIALLIVLSLLAWPLLNLAFGSATESIKVRSAILCLLAALLIPVVLIVAVGTFWSRQSLGQWMENSARQYAESLNEHLATQLGEATQLLAAYRDYYRSPDVYAPKGSPPGARCNSAQFVETTGDLQPYTIGPTATLPVRIHDNQTIAGKLQAYAQGPAVMNCTTVFLSVPAEEAAKDELGNWSPLRTVLAVNRDGWKFGPRLTGFAVLPQPTVVPVKDREYFQLIAQGRGWGPKPADAAAPPRFVAQRLFNRADGAKVLQIAIPIEDWTNPDHPVFRGAVTGDVRLHGLTASLAPPLLRFAIVDQRSGTVIFHSEDRRSLAENFYRETEQNDELMAAMRAGTGRHFNGEYLGQPYGFYYRPVQFKDPARKLPWGIVVFFPQKDLGDLRLYAGVSTLVAVSNVVVPLLLIVALLCWPLGLREYVVKAVDYLWPRAALRGHYRALGVVAPISWAVLTLALLSGWQRDWLWLALGVSVALAVVIGIRLHRHRAPPMEILSHAGLRRFERDYARCLTAVLFAPVVATLWHYLHFHDIQVQGLLDDELVRITSQLRERREAIDGDLQRWYPDREAREALYPPAAKLATLPVPGFASPADDHGWIAEVAGGVPWAGKEAPGAIGFWDETIWLETGAGRKQARRVRLHADLCSLGSPGQEVCGSPGGADGQRQTVAVPPGRADFPWASGGDLAHETFAVMPVALALLGAYVLTAWLGVFLTRRLFGAGTAYVLHEFRSRRISNCSAGTIYHRSTRERELGTDVLARLLDAVPDAKRVDLSRVPNLRDVQPEDPEGVIVLTQLEAGANDVGRRKQILDLLERLLAQEKLDIVILGENFPEDWLHHSIPETWRTRDHHPGLDESRRWADALRQLTRVDVRWADKCDEQFKKFAFPYVWMTCSHAERLMLFQLACGHLPNPRNDIIVLRLIRRGLVYLDPRPKLVSNQLQRFVRAAEPAELFAKWQHEASRSLWTSLKVPVFVVLMVIVAWLNWTMGEQFRAVSAVFIGTIAFLSQLVQFVGLSRGVATDPSAGAGAR
ncbi:MAG TPA: hypothetical protein VE046_10810 [Steroidobacteraceae bacterium]|nr:hypothetical protein [Steroidobacteraceae bacterium]